MLQVLVWSSLGTTSGRGLPSSTMAHSIPIARRIPSNRRR